MTRDLARRLFDALEGALLPAALRLPAATFLVAEALGRARQGLSGRWPSSEEVRLVFPRLSVLAARRVASCVAGNEARNRLYGACLRKAGLDPLRRLVSSDPSFARQQGPRILVAWHVGAWNSLGPALERLERPTVILRDSALYAPAPPLEVAVTHGGEQRRAAAFARALAVLGAGGFVVVTLDLPPSRGIHAPCLGRSLELARGPLALARLSGAAMAPVTATWRWRGALVTAGEPWTFGTTGAGANVRSRSESWETELAARAGAWLERTLLSAPREIGLGLLRELVRSSPADSRTAPTQRPPDAPP